MNYSMMYYRYWLLARISTLKHNFHNFKVSDFQSFKIYKFHFQNANNHNFKISNLLTMRYQNQKSVRVLSTMSQIRDPQTCTHNIFEKWFAIISCIRWTISAINNGSKVPDLVNNGQFPKMPQIILETIPKP